MASGDLCYMTASEAIARFKNKSLSPTELMEAVIARSESINPKVNAYTYTFYERALKQARDATEKYAGGATTRPPVARPSLCKRAAAGPRSQLSTSTRPIAQFKRWTQAGGCESW